MCVCVAGIVVLDLFACQRFTNVLLRCWKHIRFDLTPTHPTTHSLTDTYTIPHDLRPAQTAAFAQAVEDSLSVDADVTDVVATDITRRRLTRRQLMQVWSDATSSQTKSASSSLLIIEGRME